ncbi:MAG TPA: hypothetical protein VF544_06015 [Pyrinomonadaceae bacterium]|jgi:hypothetical protein
MLASGHSEKSVVARLRVRGAGLDPALARLRIASLLSAVSLHPSGLPPSAILVIKQLRDPLPGQVPLYQSGLLRPPARWEQAVDALLKQVARRAARPALGTVADSAEAVVFLDRSELLACMASDWCRSGALKRWWWRSLFNDQETARAIVRAWLEASAYVPAALHLLAKRGEATAFVGALSASAAQSLLRSITGSFALREIESALDETGKARPSATGRAVVAESGATIAWPSSGPRDLDLPGGPRPPWARSVPEAVGGGLAPDAQTLLGIALMLQRAPSRVRSSEFARSFSSWRRAIDSEEQARAPKSGATQSAITFNQPEKKPGELAVEFRDSAEAQPAARLDEMEHDREAAAARTASLAGKVSASFRAQSVNDESDAGGRLGGAWAQASPESAPEPASTTQGAEVSVYETELGGLFYLVNLGIFLGLYGDFTRPAELAPPLSIWDFVALVGRELLGEKIEDDPVWPLLASLACRAEGEPPGHDFRAPDSWRIPTDWLLPFAQKSLWRWEARRERLRVAHAEGFTVIDVPLGRDTAAAQLLRELEDYRGAAEFELRAAELSAESGARAELEAEGGPTRLARWLGWLMPYVRARLARALALEKTEELAHVLCEHKARVVCTATHLDVYLSLAQLPIGVRLSGLDRDPGWVPAAGRFIAFHFA